MGQVAEDPEHLLAEVPRLGYTWSWGNDDSDAATGAGIGFTLRTWNPRAAGWTALSGWLQRVLASRIQRLLQQDNLFGVWNGRYHPHPGSSDIAGPARR